MAFGRFREWIVPSSAVPNSLLSVVARVVLEASAPIKALGLVVAGGSVVAVFGFALGIGSLPPQHSDPIGWWWLVWGVFWAGLLLLAVGVVSLFVWLVSGAGRGVRFARAKVGQLPTIRIVVEPRSPFTVPLTQVDLVMAAVIRVHNIPDVDFDPANPTNAERLGLTTEQLQAVVRELLAAGWVNTTPRHWVGHVDGGVRPTNTGQLALGRRTDGDRTNG